MMHRRSRFSTWMSVLTLLIAVSIARAQTAVSPQAPIDIDAPVEAMGSAPAASTPDDRLTQLARELASVQPAEGAGAATPAIAREQQPLGGAAAARDTLAPSGSLASSAGSGAIPTLGALGLVIALILGGRWAWMRFGGVVVARSTPAVEVLSRTTITPRNHVLLLRVGGRILVVGDSSAGLRTLAQVDEPDEVASLLEAVTAAKPTSVTQGFAQLLSHNGRDFDTLAADDSAREVNDHGFDRARDSLSGLLTRVRALTQKGGTP